MNGGTGGPRHMSEEKELFREYEGKESEDDESLSTIDVDFSMGAMERSKGDGERMDDLSLCFEAKGIGRECYESQAMMSLETNLMSGLDSELINSVAMLSLDVSDVKDDPQYEAIATDTGKSGCEDHEVKYPSLCCTYEGPLSNVYRLADPRNKHGGKTNAVAIKILSDQFPDKAHIARLKNE
eukprot:2516045-Ditylum_brightwellii.AAC.1